MARPSTAAAAGQELNLVCIPFGHNRIPRLQEQDFSGSFYGWSTELTIETPERHVTAIQMLRAIAATMVVFVHIDSELLRLRLPTLGTDWMARGVDIFFVISGFIMWTSVERRGGMSAGTFIKNRLIRIVPLYWTATAIVLAVALVAPHLLNRAVLRSGHVLSSFLFLPARHPVFADAFWPLLIPGWSLNYEMLFYAIFALALALGSNSPSRRLLVITVAFGMILSLASMTKNVIDVMHFYANPMMLEFLAGIALAIVCRSSLVRANYLYLAAIALGFLLLAPATPLGLHISNALLGATLIVAGAVFLPQLRENALSRLGDASYSLYLTHGMTLSAVAWLWTYFKVTGHPSTFVLVGLACAFVVAFGTYYLFEVPVTAALKNHFAHRARVRAAMTSGGKSGAALVRQPPA
jgi:exopolysaccharide production protein ExoZ